MGNTAIRAKGLCKRYQIGTKQQQYATFREALLSAARTPFRRFSRLRGGDTSDKEMIWALRDLSFEVKHGEVLGIIGPNGAGKTTLLRVLTRITWPTQGRAEVYGRVGSLLEVGTGFHPELTGRENVYLNGALLGMKKAEIDRKFDEIVAFSGIEQFLDTPVKRYSSGMYVRLAFSVAAHLEPEILLVDEVLAVGDAEFQRKCLGKMEGVAKEGRTILFVSHNLASIQNLCSRAIVLEGGMLGCDAPPVEAIEHYLAGFDRTQSPVIDLRDHRNRRKKLPGFFEKVELLTGDKPGNVVKMGGSLKIRLHYRHGVNPARLKVVVIISDSYDQRLAELSTEHFDSKVFEGAASSGVVECLVPHLNLVRGRYYLHVGAHDRLAWIDWIDRACSIEVIESDVFGTSHVPKPQWGTFVVPSQWHCVNGRS